MSRPLHRWNAHSRSIPSPVEVRANLAALLLEMNRPARALKHCQFCLDTQPNNRLAIGYKAIALHALGRLEQARYLLDLQGMVSTEMIAFPGEFADLDDFNRVLATHIEKHPSLCAAHSSKATRHGMQTGDLLIPLKDRSRCLKQW